MTGMTTLFAIVTVTLILLFITLYFIKENGKKHKKQLELISDMANKDPLTGVKNQRAYIENEKRILSLTSTDAGYPYGLVVCDVNDLKYVNDKLGHDYGDRYLTRACQIICQVFKRSPVYRIGGDEFVVIIEGEDYMNRSELLEQLCKISMENAATKDGVVIAAGMAVRHKDEDFNSVFRQADENMYIHKKELKQIRPEYDIR